MVFTRNGVTIQEAVLKNSTRNQELRGPRRFNRLQLQHKRLHMKLKHKGLQHESTKWQGGIHSEGSQSKVSGEGLLPKDYTWKGKHVTTLKDLEDPKERRSSLGNQTVEGLL